jgi:hypothetical protein
MFALIRLSLLLLLLGVYPLFATDTPIHVTIGKTAITLGEPNLLTVKSPIGTTEKVTIEWPDTFYLITQNSGVNQSVRVNQYIFTNYSLGNYRTPTISIYRGGEAILVTGTTYSVVTAFEKSETRNFVMALKPNAKVSLHWWWYALVFAGVGSLLVAAIMIYKRIKQGAPLVVAKQVAQVLPIDKALKDLADLESSSAWEGDLKPFYFSLSQIVKEYLGATFRLQISESTTYEIRSMLSSCDLPDSLDYNRFFGSLDPVKYAKGLPTIPEARGKIANAKNLLMETDAFLNREEESPDAD